MWAIRGERKRNGSRYLILFENQNIYCSSFYVYEKSSNIHVIRATLIYRMKLNVQIISYVISNTLVKFSFNIHTKLT